MQKHTKVHYWLLVFQKAYENVLNVQSIQSLRIKKESVHHPQLSFMTKDDVGISRTLNKQE